MTTLRLTALALFFVLISGCAPAPPTATVIPTQDKQALATEIAANIFATQTANVTKATDTPTATDTPKPTNTSSPTSTRQATVTVASTNTPVTGRWKIETDISQMDDSKNVYLSLESDSPLRGDYVTYTPVLFLRCMEHEIKVFFVTGMQANVEYGLYEQATVRVRFDKDQAKELVANKSTDGKALFFRDPIGMLREIPKHNQMVFGFTPFNAAPVVTTFDLRGLSMVNQPLEEACGIAENVPGGTPPSPITEPPAKPTPNNQAGGLALTVIGFSKIQVDYKKPKAGNIFLDVEVVLENISAEPISVGVQQFDVKDSSGYVYASASGGSFSPALDPYFGYGDTLSIGEKHRGHVGFEIPEGAKGLIIMYDVAPAGRRYSDDPIIRVPLGELLSD